jgi:hypothetical protein
MPHLHRHPLAAALLAGLLISSGALAQKAVGKKIYCWDEGGRHICGDALPPEAAGRARTEISPKSGLATARVARALTDEEKAAAAQTADAERKRMEEEAAMKRRDLAMIESYTTEADLRRAYGERITLLDESLKAGKLGQSNLQTSVLALLHQAGDHELAGQPVPKRMLDSIRRQHADLLRQQAIMQIQRSDRASLDVEQEDALRRYRALKPSTEAAVTIPAPEAGAR